MKKQLNKLHRINEEIRYSQIRLVSDDGDPNICSSNEANSIALREGLDLVLLTDKGDIPICKIMDYNKFLYEKSKRDKENKRNGKNKETKEIRLGANTDENDMRWKTNNAIKFLKEGHTVKLSVFFRGREIKFKENGEKNILQIALNLSDYGSANGLPIMNGKRMEMLIAPKK